MWSQGEMGVVTRGGGCGQNGKGGGVEREMKAVSTLCVCLLVGRGCCGMCMVTSGHTSVALLLGPISSSVSL